MSLQIRQTRFDKGRPLVAVSLTGTTGEEIAEQTRKAVEQQVQVIEWRADYYLAAISDLKEKLLESEVYLDMLKIMDEVEQIAGDIPRIFTIRTKGQGGEIDLDQSVIGDIQLFMAQTGLADFVDIEVKAFKPEFGGIGGSLLKKRVDDIHKEGSKVILSYHDKEEMIPAVFIVKLVTAMSKYRPDICKVAAMANSKEDANSLIKATAYLDKTEDIPMITMAMGKHGISTRVIGGKYGSLVTFASVGAPSAPGQIPAGVLRERLDEFYGA